MAGFSASTPAITAPYTVPASGYDAVTTATASSGASSVTVASATGIIAGMTVVAAGVPYGTLVGSGYTTGTTIPLTENTTAVLSSTPISFGSMNPASQAMRLPAFAGHGTGTNLATGGWTVANIVSDYPTHVHPLSPAVTGKPGYLFVWIGFNDIYASTAAATVYANLAAYWATAKADGWNLIAFTELKSNGGGAINTNIDQFADLVRGGSANYNNLVDIHDLFPDAFDLNYFASNASHLNNTGYGRAAYEMAKIISGQSTPSSHIPLMSLGTGEWNVRDNFSALSALTTGYDETAGGEFACNTLTTGPDNTCYGANVQVGSSSVSQNTLVGSSIASGAGSFNTIIGAFSGTSSAGGGFNVCLGVATCTGMQYLNSNDQAIGQDATFSGSTTTQNAAQIGAGTNSVSSSLQFLTIPIAGGPTFTVAGCGTATSLTGYSMAGKFTGGSATCTPVITTGVTAPHGFACNMQDRTTATAAFRQTADSTTTATFTAGGTVGATDVISFACSAY
jgi:hypothetical protein